MVLESLLVSDNNAHPTIDVYDTSEMTRLRIALATGFIPTAPAFSPRGTTNRAVVIEAWFEAWH